MLRSIGADCVRRLKNANLHGLSLQAHWLVGHLPVNDDPDWRGCCSLTIGVRDEVHAVLAGSLELLPVFTRH